MKESTPHPKNLLITGCHRAGTTLLASLVGAHPEVSMINEDYHDGWQRAVGVRYRGVKMPMPFLGVKTRLPLWATYFKRKWLWLRRKLGIRTHAKTICSYSLHNFINWGGRIIFIYRAKDQNVRSILNRTNQTLRSATYDVAHAHSVQRQYTAKYPFQTMEVSLRDLSGNTEDTLKQICNFLCIDYDPRMLDGYRYQYTYPNDNGIEKKL